MILELGRKVEEIFSKKRRWRKKNNMITDAKLLARN
jgi:hypothetical protein